MNKRQAKKNLSRKYLYKKTYRDHRLYDRKSHELSIKYNRKEFFNCFKYYNYAYPNRLRMKTLLCNGTI